MTDRKQFFDRMRAGLLGPTLDQGEVTGCTTIMDAMGGAPDSHVAYALATTYHETAGTMRPIKEFGGDRYFNQRYGPDGANPRLARSLGNTQPGDGARFAGRGFVQITGRANYLRASQITGVDLIANPDRAMEPAIAAIILRSGMNAGWFTGHNLVRHLPGQTGTRPQFRAARRIINGTDKADLIAGYAMQFQAALS